MRLESLIFRNRKIYDFDPLIGAAALFIGTIQGLVMQSLLAGDLERMRNDAPGIFAIYCRGIRSTA